MRKILAEIESGYDLVAEKFSKTRSFMWRDLGFIRNMVCQEDKVLDFGCGNGRLAGFLEGNYRKYVGVDVSGKLINFAKQRYSNEKTEFIKIFPTKPSLGEIAALSGKFKKTSSFFNRLPFGDNYFDVIFSIAVFHHLPSKKFRLEIVKELRRVLKPGGKIVVSVWNLWQKRFWKYHLKAIEGKLLRKSGLDWRDIYIPFRAGDKIFHRYHHAFSIKELERLLIDSHFNIIENRKNFNIVCIAVKK